MNTKKKQILSLFIGSTVILLVLIIVAVILLWNPKSPKSRNTGKNPAVPSYTDNTVSEKFELLGRIFGADKKAVANTKFGIDCGNTDFYTDENGYFKLNGLPAGAYKIYGYDSDSNKTGITEIVLSRDGSVSIMNVVFEKGATVSMIFDGNGFSPYVAGNVVDNDSFKEVSKDDKEVVDETYTNLSWMKDIPNEFGLYGLDTTMGQNILYEVINDPQYSYLNTFIVDSRHLEQAKKSAALFAKKGKKFWLNVGALLSVGDSNPAINLPGDWHDRLDRWAAELYTAGGNSFQGFYFDEVDLYMSSINFTRVTKYMREKFGLRTFAIHRLAMITYPTKFGKMPSEYHPLSSEFCLTAENHKYVTDVGFWWYGGFRWYDRDPQRYAEIWKDAVSVLDPNTRKWIFPPCGSYDWRHDESDCLDVQYELYKMSSEIDGFGGLMLYSAGESSLWGGIGTVSPDDEKLTDEDFLKNDNGEFLLDENGNCIVSLKENHCFTNELYGKRNSYCEAHAEYYVIYKLKNGDYLWPRARKYFEILGKGITSGKASGEILNELEKVYKPDTSRYICNK